MKYLDVHAHIFPHDVAVKVVSSLEAYYGFKWNGNGEVDDLLASMSRMKIARCVVFSSATRPSQVEPINDYIASVVSQHPDKFIGFGTLHPDYPDCRREIERIGGLGLKGLKFHPDFQEFEIDSPAMLKIYEAAGDAMPMLFHVGDRHTDFSSPRRMAHVLDELPFLRVIAAHMGGYSEWPEAWRHLIGRDLWLDISSCMHLIPAAEVRRMAMAHGIDRVLFASDYPAVRHEQAVAQLDALELSCEDYEKVAHLNAEKLLNLV